MRVPVYKYLLASILTTCLSSHNLNHHLVKKILPKTALSLAVLLNLSHEISGESCFSYHTTSHYKIL